MAKQTLSADIADFIRNSEDRLLAVMRGSISDVVEQSQEPTAKGGRMRVDTGFLRASGRASLEGMPSGNGVRPADAARGSINYDGSAIQATLLKMKLGDTFYFGWVANYAEVREIYDGFLITSTQNWQSFVNKRSERFNK